MSDKNFIFKNKLFKGGNTNMKMGVREICDVVLKAKAATTIGNHTFKAGEPVIYFDTLKTSTLEGQATTVYAQGGKGNARLLAWEGERTLTFTMEDALISPKSFAILSGADLMHADDGKEVTAHATYQVEVKTDDTIVVKGKVAQKADNTYEDVYVMLLDGNGEMSGVPVKVNDIADFEYDTNDDGEDITTITINGTTTEGTTTPAKLFLVGDVVFVDFYKTYKGDAVEITISADKFAGYYYLEASTLFRRESDGVDLPAEFIIPKAKIQSAFTFTMASSGDPSTFTFTMDALPDYTKFNKTKKVLCAIQVLEADDNFDLTAEDVEDTRTYTRQAYDVDNKPESKTNAYVGYTTKSGKTYKDTDGKTATAGE
jgi:hypothetical protein